MEIKKENIWEFYESVQSRDGIKLNPYHSDKVDRAGAFFESNGVRFAEHISHKDDGIVKAYFEPENVESLTEEKVKDAFMSYLGKPSAMNTKTAYVVDSESRKMGELELVFERQNNGNIETLILNAWYKRKQFC